MFFRCWSWLSLFKKSNMAKTIIARFSFPDVLTWIVKIKKEVFDAIRKHASKKVHKIPIVSTHYYHCPTHWVQMKQNLTYIVQKFLQIFVLYRKIPQQFSVSFNSELVKYRIRLPSRWMKLEQKFIFKTPILNESHGDPFSTIEIPAAY